MLFMTLSKPLICCKIGHYTNKINWYYNMNIKDGFLYLCSRVIRAAIFRGDRRAIEDKFKRCKKVGVGIEVDTPLYFSNPENVEIGDYVHLGDHTLIDGRGGLVIGNYTIVSSFVTILTSDHQYEGAETIPFGSASLDRPVQIGDNVWIGMHVFASGLGLA